MHAQPRRALQLGAAALVGALLIAWGPGSASPAEALGVCPGSLCGPQGVAVLAAGDAMDTAVVAGSVQAGAVATTAGTAAGVGGVSFGSEAAGGAAGLLAGAAAWLGIKGWKHGTMTVAQGGATGLVAPGSPAGWAGGNNAANMWWACYSVCSGSQAVVVHYGVTGTTTGAAGSTFTVTGVPATANPFPANQSALYSVQSGGIGSMLLVTYSDGSSSGSNSAYFPPNGSSMATLVTTVPAGKTVDHVAVVRPDNSAALSGNYYMSTSPSYPPGTSSGSGTVTQHLHCVGANGASQDLQQSFTANVGAAGSFTFPDLTCPAGMVAGSFSADLTPSGGGTPQPMIPTTVAPSTVTSIPTNQPGCVDSACTLRLFRSATQGSTATDCGDYAMACPQWYTDPSRSSNYECHWGPYVVALDQCSVYRVPGEILPNTKVNADGTSTYVQWPPLPAPAASSDPGPSSQSCLPSGWGAFNPIEWVLLPSECALRWAFVPSAATSTAWKAFVTDASARPPVNVAIGGVAFTTGVVNSLGNGTGDCSSLPLQMAGGPLGPSASFDLCAGVQQAGQTTWGQRLRDVLTVVFIGGGCWIAYHRVAKSFGGKG